MSVLMPEESLPEVLMPTYARLPVSFVRGEGCWLYDTDGNAFLDALSGISVCNLGHAHPVVAECINRQAGKLLHTSNLYGIPSQEALAARLLSLADMERAFFCNSGAEANEAALKLARLHAYKRGLEQAQIIVMEGAFHGRTIATLSASGQAVATAHWSPLLPGFRRVPFADVDSLREVFQGPHAVGAVIMEAVQGEGGIRLATDAELQAIRALCDAHDALLIMDEVQSGMCRTGEWFAFQHAGILPDVVTLAKALGNGIPIGACLARGDSAELFSPGMHGSTFGGSPFASTVALEVVRLMDQQRLAERARKLGESLLSGLREELKDRSAIKAIRGRGLMIGIELDREATVLPALALEHGLLVNVTAGCVVRLLPPLVISEQEIKQLQTRLVSSLDDFFSREIAA